MKLTDAQFGALSTLAQFGTKELVEIHGPRGMDGRRNITVQGIMSAPTLAKLEQAHLIAVDRSGPALRPVNAVGKAGHLRFPLTVSITDAGRAALASAQKGPRHGRNENVTARLGENRPARAPVQPRRHGLLQCA